MKKLYTLLLITLLGNIGNAQIVNIPDANFKARLIAMGVDTNFDGNIQLSETEAVYTLGLDAIADLTGINSFSNLVEVTISNSTITSLGALNGLTNLKRLYCMHNQINTLTGLSGLPNLEDLYCSNNPLTTLVGLNSLPGLRTLVCDNIPLTDLSSISDLTNLRFLSCCYCGLTSLSDINSLTNLQYLWCNGNNSSVLSTISGMTNLRELFCSHMALSSLDAIAGMTNLTSLGISYNNFSNLNLAVFPNLTKLYCGYNNLTTLDVSMLPNLDLFNCQNNHITTLNVAGLSLMENLECQNNELTNLDLTGLTTLVILDCTNNTINNLDFSGIPQLAEVWCSENNLTSIDVSGLYQMTTLVCSNMPSLVSIFAKNNSYVNYHYPFNFSGDPNLTFICVDDYEVPYVESYIADYGYTNCHTNSYCTFAPGGPFYTIQGNSKYDIDSNGCDAEDSMLPFVNYAITDGVDNGHVFADSTGNYTIPVGSGTHTLSPILENPEYYTISPTSAVVTFPTDQSPSQQNFCITANGPHQDIEITLLPLGEANPGFDSHYMLIYKNKGNSTVSGSIQFTFDNTVANFLNATPPPLTLNTNTLVWDYANLQPFESREIAVTLILHAPSDEPPLNAGDQLSFLAVILPLSNDEFQFDNSSALKQMLVASHDPNDKTCLEGTTITPSMVGQYVHYVIRFENTGTANAHNIVVKDMIDTNKFDLNTLVPLHGSASFVTRITNTNQVEFIFENINLPFDDANNDGYVAFKIKTKPTLVLGDTFDNTASIYFDYNFPIVTNTASTTVAVLATQDFDFSAYFSVYPVPAKQVLHLQTKGTIGVKAMEIYNLLGQMVLAIPNAQNVSTIDVADLKSGTYFIKVTTDKGTANTKFVKE